MSQLLSIVSNFDAMIRFAEALSKADMLPKEYQGNVGNILVAMQYGQELGIGIMQALQSVTVINGKPCLYGDTMLAIVRASGFLEAISEDVTDDRATCTVKRKGEQPVTRVFTASDAKRAGLWNKPGPWQQYPRRMLQMRARAYALRDVFPDVLRGLYAREEMIGGAVIDAEPLEQIEQNAAENQLPQPQSKTAALLDKIAARKEQAASEEQASTAEQASKEQARAQQKKDAPSPSPLLADILSAIKGAKSKLDLDAVAKRAMDLHGRDREIARNAFAKRMSEINMGVQ